MWDLYTPANIDELQLDFGLTNSDFENKYGLTKQQARENISIIETVPTELFFGSPNENTAESDGKDNVTINGVPQTRQLIIPGQIGDWHYTIKNGERLDCIFTIQPPVV